MTRRPTAISPYSVRKYFAATHRHRPSMRFAEEQGRILTVLDPAMRQRRTTRGRTAVSKRDSARVWGRWGGSGHDGWRWGGSCLNRRRQSTPDYRWCRTELATRRTRQPPVRPLGWRMVGRGFAARRGGVLADQRQPDRRQLHHAGLCPQFGGALSLGPHSPGDGELGDLAAECVVAGRADGLVANFWRCP